MQLWQLCVIENEMESKDNKYYLKISECVPVLSKMISSEVFK